MNYEELNTCLRTVNNQPQTSLQCVSVRMQLCKYWLLVKMALKLLSCGKILGKFTLYPQTCSYSSNADELIVPSDKVTSTYSFIFQKAINSIKAHQARPTFWLSNIILNFC